MKTPREFDYNLWTTGESEEKKYWVKIKATGEVTEISHEVMKYLRSEEKRMRREAMEVSNGKSPLHLNIITNDENAEYWLSDSFSVEDEVLTKISIEKFLCTLTLRQQDIYRSCMEGGMMATEYAEKNSLHRNTVLSEISVIREKFTISLQT
jgi:hypothetical protein